ncbi:MAG: LysM peptidoglycan-binding domain-containing protein [Dehalobacterium sp.]|jgi:polysaccharide deacetylase family sporulation protein PdaB
MPEVLYTVQPGDTLYGIARQYGSTVSAIASVNSIVDPNQIMPGTSLIIPTRVMEPPGGPPPGGIIYTVQSGDTLTKIAQSYGITMRSILDLNNIPNPDLIFPGTKLLLPENAREPGMIIYVVRPGDTLYSIALRFRTTVPDLIRINNIQDPDVIQIGQVLNIAAPGTGQAIYRGNPAKRMVALTFDATYGDNQTTTLLNILAQNNVRATFFLSGIWLENYPQLARDIASAGHEIGNHSYTHPHLPQLTVNEVTDQILRTGTIIRTVTGRIPYLFRPPFGEYTQMILNVIANLGYLTIMWTVDSLDWQNPGVEAIANRVVNNIKPGAIVLMHQAAAQTPQALPAIIARLQDQGYDFGTVTEVLDP